MRVCVAAILLGFFRCTSVALADPKPLEIDVVRSDIEELLEISVTSVSKVSELANRAAAAVFVLTHEDIERSGATSVPEALRYVPGVQVSRVDANKWAVSIRGFNSRSANKLLVLIDGRSIYDPLFGGVLWETKDVQLADVERIEVIRGPGASIWGANAVNGVINIITRDASKTVGGFVSAGGGTEERQFSSARYGVALSDESFLRIYGEQYQRDGGYLNGDSEDDSSRGHGGFRFDGKVAENEHLTVTGDFYNGDHHGVTAANDIEGSGGHILGRWEQKRGENSALSVQASYDRADFEAPVLAEGRDTGNIELQYSFPLSESHAIVSGAGYRLSSDHVRNSPVLALRPRDRTDDTLNAFIEDEITIIPERLLASVGTKVEHNDYTGVEVQPRGAITWIPDDRQVVWASVGRAVRTPTRLEDDLEIALPDGTVFAGISDPSAEELISYELGYRVVPMNAVHLDIASFYNRYDNLLTVEGLEVGNLGKAETYGFEAAVTWAPTQTWSLRGMYSLLVMDLSQESESLQPPSVGASVEGSNRRNTASIISRIDLGSQVDLDIGIRYVDSLPALDVSSYVVADARIAWHPTENLELELVGQNLFDRRHFEQSGASASEVQQGVYGGVTVRF